MKMAQLQLLRVDRADMLCLPHHQSRRFKILNVTCKFTAGNDRNEVEPFNICVLKSSSDILTSIPTWKYYMQQIIKMQWAIPINKCIINQIHFNSSEYCWHIQEIKFPGQWSVRLIWSLISYLQFHYWFTVKPV
jgi:hypothetical protein